MQDFEFYQPSSLAELSEVLVKTRGKILAGGTDIIPRMRQNHFAVPALVDASGISELRFIDEKDGWVNIGALSTHRDIENSSLLQKLAPALVEAAASIGSPQTRTRGTLGGNLCNASPAADLAPSLLTFEAEVCLYKNGSFRYVKLRDFFLAPGKTVAGQDEILQSIRFPALRGAWGTAFLKLGKRNGMAISIANAAVSMMLRSSGEVDQVRVALGSVAPTPILTGSVAQALIEKKPSLTVIQKAAEACKQDIHPISDVRSSAEYRIHTAVVLVKRALMMAASKAEEVRSA